MNGLPIYVCAVRDTWLEGFGRALAALRQPRNQLERIVTQPV
jgi:hypothetical protein